MKAQIFVNLPVKDLERSMAFYTAIGFVNNPQFTDETAAAMVLNDHIYVMLLTHSKFLEFTPREISDAHKQTEVLNALGLSSLDEVHAMTNKAINHGGSEIREPQDYGFMFSRAFDDLDGHIWETVWMDPNAQMG